MSMTKLIGAFHTCSEISSRPLMEIRWCSLGVICTAILSSKIKISTFFNIQGPRIFASTLWDFHESIRMIWTNDFSFPWAWCSEWLHIYLSGIQHATVSTDTHVLRIIVIQLNYGHSKSVIDSNKIDYSKFWESKNVNILTSSMKINSKLPQNYLQHCVVCIQQQIFSISFISKICISLQASCQIFIDWLARLGETFFILFIVKFKFTFRIWGAMFRCCQWCVFHGELWLSCWLMDIPNWLLNCTDRIAHGFERVGIQTLNRDMVLREASRQIDSPRSR
jgi:hypothetical protein